MLPTRLLSQMRLLFSFTTARSCVSRIAYGVVLDAYTVYSLYR